MKRRCTQIIIAAVALFVCPEMVFSLGEEQITVTYKIVHATSAGALTSYAHYSIVAYEEGSYWLQRTISMAPSAKPVSITQTLLDSESHQALRYIMHRPAKRDRPPSVIDLPLERMGKDEILPLPQKGLSGVTEPIRTETGEFETVRVSEERVTLWLSSDIPVMGVAKAETDEFTMELFHMSDTAHDLFSKRPSKGGVVYLEDE